MLPIASEGKAATPHRPGRGRDAPQSSGSKGEPLTASRSDVGTPPCVRMKWECTSSRWKGKPRPLAASGGSGVPHGASEWNVGTPLCVPMRCQNSSLRPSEMGCSSSHRREMPKSLTASGGSGVPRGASEWNVGTPHCVPMRCQNSSLPPNEMGCRRSRREQIPRPLPGSGGNGMPSEHGNETSEPLPASQ
jgi:hypothetical protein